MTLRAALAGCVLAATALDGVRAERPEAAIAAATGPGEVLAIANRILETVPVRADADVSLDDSGRVISSSERILALDAAGRRLRESHPTELGQWSARILDSLDVPDERLVAARNLAWSGGDPRVATVLREILQEAHNGGAGRFAAVQAMDGVVYLKDASMLPEIVTLLESEDFEIAAAQNLDRLAAVAPLETMVVLDADRELLRDRPMLRADCHAKADLSEKPQREAFERYLLCPDVPDRAKEKAILGLAQRGHMLTIGLFGGATSPREASRAAVAGTLTSWLSREEFRPLHPAMRECLDWVGNFGAK